MSAPGMGGHITGTESDSQALPEQLLTDAYEFVLSGWCQGATALDESGRPIEPASAAARKWSALGALERAWRRSDDPGVLDAFHRAKLALTAAVNDVPQAWNDRPDRHQSQVLSALAQAVHLPTLPVASVGDHDDVQRELDVVARRSEPDAELRATIPAQLPLSP
jgi:hypothetical protein